MRAGPLRVRTIATVLSMVAKSAIGTPLLPRLIRCDRLPAFRTSVNPLVRSDGKTRTWRSHSGCADSGALPARAAIRGRLTRSTHSQAHGEGSPGYAAACSDRKAQRTCGDRRVRPVHMSPPTHTPHRRLHRWRRSGFGTSWTAPAPQRSRGRSAGSPTALAASGPSLARRCSCRARQARRMRRQLGAGRGVVPLASAPLTCANRRCPHGECQ